MAANEIWSHSNSSQIFGLINNPSNQIANLALLLLESIMRAVPSLVSQRSRLLHILPHATLDLS